MEVLNIEDYRYNGQGLMVLRTLQVQYGSVKHRILYIYNGQCFMVLRTLQVQYGSVKHRRL